MISSSDVNVGLQAAGRDPHRRGGRKIISFSDVNVGLQATGRDPHRREGHNLMGSGTNRRTPRGESEASLRSTSIFCLFPPPKCGLVRKAAGQKCGLVRKVAGQKCGLVCKVVGETTSVAPFPRPKKVLFLAVRAVYFIVCLCQGCFLDVMNREGSGSGR